MLTHRRALILLIVTLTLSAVFAGCGRASLMTGSVTAPPSGPTSLPPPEKPQVSNGVALWLSQNALPTSGALTVQVNLAIGSTANPPAGVQWTLNYPPADFSAIQVTAGSVATAASKVIVCNSSTAGTSLCLVYGMNDNMMAEGTVATITLTQATSGKSSSLQLSGGVSADPAGTSIPTSVYGLSAVLH